MVLSEACYSHAASYALSHTPVPSFTSGRTMTHTEIPLIIPVLATGYLLAIYLLLTLARRSGSWRRPEG